MKSLTDRQKMALKYIRDYTDEHGYPPTLREIGRHIEIKSTNGVKDHLKALERKGSIHVTPMTSRAIRLLFDPWKELLGLNE